MYNKKNCINYLYFVLDISDILKKAPTKHELLELLADIEDKWYEIGLSFDVPRNILDGLERRSDSNTVKLSKVIDSWINTNEVTWDKVISAISGPIVSNKKKADEIYGHLTKGKYKYLSIVSYSYTTYISYLGISACQILQKYDDRLSSLILPMEVVQMLYAERVISKETLDEVNKLGGVIGEGPLRTLCTTVYEDPNKLKIFASVLLKSEQTVVIAKSILKEYSKCICIKFTNNVSYIDTTQVKLQVNYHKKFDEMRVAFGELIVNVSPLIAKSMPSLEDLKLYLRRCFQDLRPQLVIAESFDDVMDLVQDTCTIINVCCLEAIVYHYKITEAEPHITKFKTTVDTFCDNVRADICLKQNFKTTSSSHHLICETIEFLVEWRTNECTLRHIKDLLLKAFEDMAKSVHVITIDDGNSITIICYAPLRLMDFLLMSAKENLDLLKKMGVIKLTIGYHTIYDKSKSDEVRDI